jgi:plastocyanin
LKFAPRLLTAACLVGAAHASTLTAVVKDAAGRPLQDAVVLATPLDPKAMAHAPPPGESVDQVDKQFVPYVKPILVGSTLRFPNNDNIRHQVYSFSPPKKFELPLYAGSQAPPVLFDQPGVVVLGCNIHDWMVGYVYVADTPYFAKTEADGAASFTDLPPGDYSVRVWHPAMQGTESATVRRISVGSDAQRVQWQIAVKAGAHIPRLSGAAGASYP